MTPLRCDLRLLWALLGALGGSLACSTGDGKLPDASAGSGASAGSAGAGSGGSANAAGSGAAGEAGARDPGPRCDPAANAFRRIEAPNPLISIGKRIEASDGVTNAELVVDGLYHSGTGARFRPTPEAPQWLAIEVGEGPRRLLLNWTDTAFGNHTGSRTIPADYRVETAEEFGVEDGAWEIAIEVEDNAVRSRAHAFDFEGKRWVRLVVTRSPAEETPVSLDEIALYDASEASGGRPDDTWFFLGDSITAGGFPRNFRDANFDLLVNAARPDFTPAFVNGGVSGETLVNALDRIDAVLEANAAFRYFAIGYGTNDSWGNQDVEGVHFERDLDELVERVIAAGAVPILARIPYATVDHATLAAFNAVIDRVTAERGLPCGPDLFAWFEAHPDELTPDGVHPTSDGYRSLNRLWAEAALALYPAAE